MDDCVLSKGAFQVGAIKYLYEHGEVFDRVYGTSVGALNAVGLAYGSPGELEITWRTIKSWWQIMRPNWHFWSGKGLFHTWPLRDTIETYVHDTQHIKPWPTVCFTDTYSGRLHYSDPKTTTSNGLSFTSAVVASASFPIIMTPVGGRYTDGGVRETTPLKRAIQDGADDVTIVMASPLKYTEAKPKNLFSFTMRIFETIQHENVHEDIDLCVLRNHLPEYRTIKLRLIQPDKLLLGAFDFKPNLIAAAIEQGYDAAADPESF